MNSDDDILDLVVFILAILALTMLMTVFIL